MVQSRAPNIGRENSLFSHFNVDDLVVNGLTFEMGMRWALDALSTHLLITSPISISRVISLTSPRLEDGHTC